MICSDHDPPQDPLTCKGFFIAEKIYRDFGSEFNRFVLRFDDAGYNKKRQSVNVSAF
jgi:hypothetical protein